MMSYSFARRSCLAVAAWSLISCGDLRNGERSQPRVVAPPATPKKLATFTPTTPMRDECFGADSSETSAMQCATGFVDRFGDTLQIRLAGAGVRKRVNTRSDQQFAAYRYAGRIGGSSGGPMFHVLEGRRPDFTWVELINALSGDSLILAARPLISPDGARFVVDDMGGFETCEAQTVLQVWRITGDSPVRELDLQPFHCANALGWGPSDVQWRSADTISFLRNTVPRDSLRQAKKDWDTVRTMLIHTADGWVLEPKP